MSVANFILIVTAISFATGFFVAAIIWLIKWSILSGDKSESYRTTISRYLSGLFQNKSDQNDFLSFGSNNDSLNKELYRYYHGKN
jgi:hypothetical protein